MLGRNVPTQSALGFMEADGLLPLPGISPDTARVEIIWLPNVIWTRVEQVLVIARDGDQLIWEYEIDDPSEAGTGEVIPFPPTPTTSPETEGDDSLVKPKAKPGALPKKN